MGIVSLVGYRRERGKKRGTEREGERGEEEREKGREKAEVMSSGERDGKRAHRLKEAGYPLPSAEGERLGESEGLSFKGAGYPGDRSGQQIITFPSLS